MLESVALCLSILDLHHNLLYSGQSIYQPSKYILKLLASANKHTHIINILIHIFLNGGNINKITIRCFKQPIKSKFYFCGFQLTFIQKYWWYQKRVWCEDVNIRKKDENEHLLHDDLFKKKKQIDWPPALNASYLWVYNKWEIFFF